jgi:hypothetical protein
VGDVRSQAAHPLADHGFAARAVPSAPCARRKKLLGMAELAVTRHVNPISSEAIPLALASAKEAA